MKCMKFFGLILYCDTLECIMLILKPKQIKKIKFRILGYYTKVYGAKKPTLSLTINQRTML